jgi:hypothetical protein
MQTTDHNQAPKQTVILQDEGLRKLKGFVQIPKAILVHQHLSYGAKVAYGILLGYAWQEEFCFPAQHALATDLACSVRQARRLLDELKQGNFISWRQQGLNKPNIYYILPLPTAPVRENVAQNKDGTNLSHQERTYVAGQDRTNLSAKEYSRNNIQTVNVNAPSKNQKTGKLRKSQLAELPNLAIPEEEIEALTEQLVQTFADEHSRNYFRLAAAKIPRTVIARTISDIRKQNADNPSRLFTFRMELYAQEHVSNALYNHPAFHQAAQTLTEHMTIQSDH